MTRYHRTTATLNLAREMAKKVMQLKKNIKTNDTECRYEIDDLASMAQMILLEVEEREKPYIKYSNRMSDEEWKDWQDQLEKEGE